MGVNNKIIKIKTLGLLFVEVSLVSSVTLPKLSIKDEEDLHKGEVGDVIGVSGLNFSIGNSCDNASLFPKIENKFLNNS